MKIRLPLICCFALVAVTACSDGSNANEAPTTTVDPIVIAIDAGNVAACKDGGFSDNPDFGATCSSAGGVDEWLAPYGECADGKIITMSEDASCSNDDFKALLPIDYVPSPKPGDVARCKDGVFSDNPDFGATCSSAGGVDEWLAPYGECADGKIITMSDDASCSDDDFKGLLPIDYVPTTGIDQLADCAPNQELDDGDGDGFGTCVAPLVAIDAAAVVAAAGLPAGTQCNVPATLHDGSTAAVRCNVVNLDGSEGTWSFTVNSDGSVLNVVYGETKAAPLTRDTCTEKPDEGQFEKDSGAYIGHCLHFYAYVFQFDANTGPCTFLGNYGDRAWNRNYKFGDAVIRVDGGAACDLLGPVVEDNLVEVWALATGIESYDTVAGGTNTYTSFELVDIEVYNQG